MGRSLFATLTVGFWLFFCGEFAASQVTSASLSGTVKDVSGAVLPGVSITINNLDIGTSRPVITDDQGRYHAPNLALGNYEIQAELAGFQTAIRSGIKLTVGREAVVDFTMKLGELTEKVVVSGEAPLVDTTSSTLGGLIDDKTIRDLPLNGRDITQLLFLQPGVTFSRRGSSSSGAGYGKRVSISGGRATTTGWLLDGADVNSTMKSGPATASGSFLGVEMVKEFKLVTSSMSAEYGSVSGGVMNAVSKCQQQSGPGGPGSVFRCERL